MGTMASQITSLTIVYLIVYSGADQRKHQSSASLAFLMGINRWRVNSPTKGQYRGKCFHLMTSPCISILDLLSVVDICETYRISDTNISAAIVRSVNQWTLNICSQFGQYVRSSNTDLLTGKYRVVYEYFACSQCLVYLPDKGLIYTGACVNNIPDSKVHGAIMGPIWGRQDPGGPHVGPMNLAIWDRLWTALKTVFTYRGLMTQRCVKGIRHQKFCNCQLPVAR